MSENQDQIPPWPAALAVSVVERMVALLGSVAQMTDPMDHRRGRLVEGLADLVSADVWIWFHARSFSANLRPEMLNVLSGGWREQSAFKTVTLTAGHAEWLAEHHELLDAQVHRTCTDEDYGARGQYEAFRRTLGAEGLGRMMCSTYPLGESMVSGIALHRRMGAGAYTPEERCIVHVVLSQIDWLHRAHVQPDGRASSDGKGQRLQELSPRQREVLMCLVAGDSRKQIAGKLGISVHTVADHMKALYRFYNVNSRGELLSQFISGGSSSRF